MQLPALANVVPDPIATAEHAQAMLDKNVYTAVIVGLCFAVVALFAALLRVQSRRVGDRDAIQSKLDALARDSLTIVKENSQSNFMLVRTIDELRSHIDELRGKRRPPAKEP